MDKNVFTKREELVCGKLDELSEILITFDSVRGIELVNSIREDCERMENKLLNRKNRAEEYEELLQRILDLPIDINKDGQSLIKEFNDLLDKVAQIDLKTLGAIIR
jgi:ribonuclease PH